MAKRLKIGIDLDGVCGDFLTRAREIFLQLYGIPDPSAVQTAWGFESLGLSREQQKEVWKIIDATPNWWEGHAPMDGTTFLRKMADDHTLFFITARQQGLGDPIEVQTANWLCGNFGIMYPTVIVSHQKGPIAKALELDYFIDDRDLNCYEVAEAIGYHKVYIHDATYNQEATGLKRVINLDDFFDKIGALDGDAVKRS